ncbi:MAG: response regulator [Rhodoplanes sp.]|jgi:two-component system, NtrC family, sensor kinase
MVRARRATLRILRTLMVGSLAVPAVLFAYAAWVSWGATYRSADDRIVRSLDVLHEQTLKVLLTGQLVLDEVAQSVQGLSDDQVRALEPQLHARLKRVTDMLPQLQSIWVIDRDGFALVSSRASPPPRSASLSDRDFFQAQVDKDQATYVGSVHAPRLVPGPTFFSFSRRRTLADGFNGIVTVSLLPSDFEKFYAEISRGLGAYFAMIREDGAFLTRYPDPAGPGARLNMPKSSFAVARRTNPERGIYTAVGQLDGLERRFGYRKVEGFPVYVVAGLGTAEIRNEWLSSIGGHLIFGIPASLLVFTLLGLAIQRTRNLYAEADRREAAESALRQAQRLEALGRLTGGVAHDFNNLLMVISGSVTRLCAMLEDEKATRLCDMISTAAKRAETLTRQLLSFSRQQAVNPQGINVAHRLPELIELVRSSLTDNIVVTVDIPDENCPVNVDLSEFEVAVLNICVNARDAMPSGGRLHIGVHKVTLTGDPALDGLSGQFVELTFADTGTGIPRDILHRVFEPFFTTKDATKGTGLGLSQVYGFAKQAGGTTTIASWLGRGTVVSMYLPQKEFEPRPVEAQHEVPAPATQRKTVLVVEDNLPVAEVCKSFLDQLGYDVEFAASPHDALRFLQGADHVDVVLTDILMPGGMSGLDLARKLRQTRPSLPILLMTGFSDCANEVVHDGFPVLRKPFDLTALRSELSAIWERREVSNMVG